MININYDYKFLVFCYFFIIYSRLLWHSFRIRLMNLTLWTKVHHLVFTCMIVETILHICNTKQYIINNLIKVYTNFQWKFEMILDCTFCAFLHSGKCLHRESALLQKDWTRCMHSSLNTKIHFKEVYLSRRYILHCKSVCTLCFFVESTNLHFLLILFDS